jgi:hypothetical protein
VLADVGVQINESPFDELQDRVRGKRLLHRRIHVGVIDTAVRAVGSGQDYLTLANDSHLNRRRLATRDDLAELCVELRGE